MGHGRGDQLVNEERLREIYAGVMASRGGQGRRRPPPARRPKPSWPWSAAKAARTPGSPRWTTS